MEIKKVDKNNFIVTNYNKVFNISLISCEDGYISTINKINQYTGPYTPSRKLCDMDYNDQSLLQFIKEHVIYCLKEIDDLNIKFEEK